MNYPLLQKLQSPLRIIQEKLLLWREQLLTQGLLQVALKLRLGICILFTLRYIVLPYLFQDAIKVPFWLPLFYFLYLCRTRYLSKHNWLFFQSDHNKLEQITVDIVFITVVYWLQSDIKSDVYLFYFVPMLVAARYLNLKSFSVMMLLVVLCITVVSFIAPNSPDRHMLPVPFQAPMRYVIVLIAIFLRLIF